MFSPDIVCSDAFLDMPPTTRELYFQLAMRADDDGFVNPRSTMRLVSATQDDLKLLLAKRFALPFESGVVVIKHWLIHNLIRADLYKETLYKKEKALLGLNENGAYTELREGISELKMPEAPKWLKLRRGELRTANVPQTARRLGKVRLGKVRIGKETIVAEATEWSFEEEIKKLLEDKRKHLNIIAVYWKEKGWKFENKEQFNTAIRREVKPAFALKGYTGEQILQAFDFCTQKYPEIWTLETCIKSLPALINQK
jgi:hypothetical protein